MQMRRFAIHLVAVGVLTAGAHGQSITTTYTYDLVGNRRTATSLVRPTGPRVTTVEPRVGPVGTIVNIFGTGLPAGDASGFAVTFSEIEAPILSIAPTVMTVEVPEGATNGPVIVTLPDNSEIDLGQFRMFTICWSGNGDATSWDDPVNWDLNRIPDRFDEVGVPSNPNTTVVRFSGNTLVIGITCEEPFEMVSGRLETRQNASLDDSFVLSAGTLTAGATIKVGGPMIWSRGSIEGAGTLQPEGGLEISGPVQLVDRVLQIATDQTTTLIGEQASLRLWNDAQVLNEGTFRIESGGTMDRGGRGDQRFVNTGVFEKTGPGTLNLSIPFENANELNVDAGTIRFLADSSHGGKMTGGEDSTIQFVVGTHSLADTSEIIAENVRISGGVVDIEGVYDVAGKTWSSGGATNFLPGANVVSIGAELEISFGTMTFDSDDNFTVEAYAQTLGTVQGTVSFDVTGPAVWSGGTIAGTGTTTFAGGLTIDGFVSLAGERTVEIPSGQTTVFTDSDAWLRIGNDSRFHNMGRFEAQTDGTMDQAGAGDARFVNSGVFDKLGPGDMLVRLPFENSNELYVDAGSLKFFGDVLHTGTLTGESGASIEFGVGAHTMGGTSELVAETVVFSGGTSNLEGMYDVSGTTRITGGVTRFLPTANIVSLGSELEIRFGTLNFDSDDDLIVNAYVHTHGTIQGGAGLVIQGEAAWSGGTMGGTGVTTFEGGLTIDGFVSLAGSRIVEIPEGRTVIFTDSDAWLRIGNDAQFHNMGQFEARADGTMDRAGAGDARFVNFGVFDKLGPGELLIRVPFDNSNEINADAGVLGFLADMSHTGVLTALPGASIEFGPGTHTMSETSELIAESVKFSGGTTIIEGVYDVSGKTRSTGGLTSFAPSARIVSVGRELEINFGTLTFDSGDDFTVDSYVQSGGTVRGAADFVVQDSATWSGGTISGIGTTTFGGGLTIEGFVVLGDSRVAVNPKDQTTVFTDSDAWLRLANDASFHNMGRFEAEVDGTMDRAGAGTARFVNSGVFEKRGADTMSVGVAFENSGDVELNAGIFRMNAFPFQQSDGGLTLNGGDVTSLNEPLHIEGGVVSGTGTITADISNAGEFSPGFGPGAITVDGWYDQADPGSLTIEIGGAGDPCSQVDLLDVTETALLAGTLNIVLTDGCEPELGERFEVLRYEGLVGEFDTITGLQIGNGLVFTPRYEPDVLVLEVVEP